MKVKEFLIVYTGGNLDTSSWTPEAIMDFAEAYHQKSNRLDKPVKPDFCEELVKHIKLMIQCRENAKDEEGNIYLGCKIQLLTLNHLLIYIEELSKNSV